jgi:hypothetical protein
VRTGRSGARGVPCQRRPTAQRLRLAGPGDCVTPCVSGAMESRTPDGDIAPGRESTSRSYPCSAEPPQESFVLGAASACPEGWFGRGGGSCRPTGAPVVAKRSGRPTERPVVGADRGHCGLRWKERHARARDGRRLLGTDGFFLNRRAGDDLRHEVLQRQSVDLAAARGDIHADLRASKLTAVRTRPSGAGAHRGTDLRLANVAMHGRTDETAAHLSLWRSAARRVRTVARVGFHGARRGPTACRREREDREERSGRPERSGRAHPRSVRRGIGPVTAARGAKPALSRRVRAAGRRQRRDPGQVSCLGTVHDPRRLKILGVSRGSALAPSMH